MTLGLTRLLQASWPLLAATFAFVLSASGLLAPADNLLRDLRFAMDRHSPTGSIVLVDIDPKSLAAIGVWPWPRRIYGEILDRLMEYGALDVAFDVDFSTASNEQDDALFEAALQRAGGYAMLAAFRQLSGSQAEPIVNMPLPRFRRYADPVAVNVAGDLVGNVRYAPYGLTLDGQDYPSLAAVLAGVDRPAGTHFIIDYAIDVSAIDRIPVADLLAGRIDPSRVADRQVVVGASALELRDTLIVPKHGIVPGPLVQVLAAETLKLERALTPMGLVPVAVCLLVGGLVAARLRSRLTVPLPILAAAAAAIAVEVTALLLQMRWGLLLDTAAIQGWLLVTTIGALADEASHKRRLLVAALREHARMGRILDRVVADNFDGVAVIDEHGKIIAASQLAETLLGGDLLGRTAQVAFPAPIRAAVEDAWASAPASTSQAREASIPTPLHGDRIIEFACTRSIISDETSGAQSDAKRIVCLTFRDITERRHAEDRLAYLARHDTLTGTLSRDELARQLGAEPFSGGATILVLGIGRLGSINQALGHEIGDLVLTEVADRIRSARVGLIARLNGHSFAIAIARLMTEDEITALCGTLRLAMSAPFQPAGHRLLLDCRIGVTTTDRSGTVSPSSLLSHADMAQALARENPELAFLAFRPEMESRMKSTRDLELSLREAIAARRLKLHFQPQVDLRTGGLIGAEALVRWHDAELGDVPPARFVKVAEETGLIVELGAQVMEMACTEAKRWPAELRVAVNVSPMQFLFDDVVGRVRSALDKSGLSPARLDIEITEGTLLAGGPAVIETLERLRQLGVGLALDDFGTGYSSLGYLANLPVDKLKIDQSFVRRINSDASVEAIVETVLHLCRRLGITVVAEGIETVEQREWLASRNCDVGQGYLFGRPAAPHRLVELYHQQGGAALVA